jgi:hypothetical protein
MLKSSIASPGASMSIEERIRVRYMLAKPGTIVTALVSRDACPYFSSTWNSTYNRSR